MSVGVRVVGGHPEVGSVILSAAKDLRSVQREILRCAQDDRQHGDQDDR